jgi:hypothetical protein
MSQTYSSALQEREAFALTAGGLITRQSTFADRTSSGSDSGSVKSKQKHTVNLVSLAG